MGLADVVRRGLSAVVPVKAGPLDRGVRGYNIDTPAMVETVLGMGPDELWRTQPYLRTVVTFLARNIAQLGLQVFRRVSDTDRQRAREHPVSQLLARPNPHTTGYELVYGLAADLALYDRGHWLFTDDPEAPSGFTLTRIPPSWVQSMRGGNVFAPDTYVVQNPDGSRPVDVPASQMLTFHGWSPDSLRDGSSPVDALKQVLAEQIEAQSYRQQVWRRGGRISAVLTRPPGVAWSDTARERFKADWRARWTGRDGQDAGGTPILEDGMDVKRLGFSAHEEEFIEAAKLALTVVASVFHINPTMIGLLDSANYSNVREFRRMLYGDTLGPVLAQIEDRVNTFLVPQLPDTGSVYVEFNIAEKLQGSFEEQSQALQSAVGRPWMTADEARSKLNMRSLGGAADQLVTPLNVLIGGQSSPTDSGTQNLASAQPRVKARADQSHEDKYAEVLAGFFRRQGTVVRSRLGAKADADWWDTDRWDTELAADLYRLAVQVTKQVAGTTLEGVGFSPDLYDVDRTVNFLTEVTKRAAAEINATTRDQIESALSAEDPAEATKNVFDVAETSRAQQIGVTTVTAMSGFAVSESAKQAIGDRATKTWVTGPNPRSSHAALDGETVSLNENFSNGLAWPGDAGDPDEVAGCNCSMTINTP